MPDDLVRDVKGGKHMKLSGCSHDLSAFPWSPAIFCGFILEAT